MRVAVVGLGSIAQKAYLPVLTGREDLELVFCSRDQARLQKLAKAHGVGECVADVGDLEAKGVEAAFVHTSTESHVQVVERLLHAGIHVYVDKPIAYTYEAAQRAVDTAERAGRILMVGFNRRFAPMYRALLATEQVRLLFLQKNRMFSPDYARRVVFDDFIHVVDTLRFLAPGQVKDVWVSAHHHDGRLHHVAEHLEGDGYTAMGVMNRDNGAVEETLEVMSPGNKWVVRGLNTTVHYSAGEERTERFPEWATVLERRGFPQIVDHFLESVRHDRAPQPFTSDALRTHAFCERIVQELERCGAAAWTGDLPESSE